MFLVQIVNGVLSSLFQPLMVVKLLMDTSNSISSKEENNNFLKVMLVPSVEFFFIMKLNTQMFSVSLKEKLEKQNRLFMLQRFLHLQKVSKNSKKIPKFNMIHLPLEISLLL
jgi:hypothetical protein